MVLATEKSKLYKLSFRIKKTYHALRRERASAVQQELRRLDDALLRYRPHSFWATLRRFGAISYFDLNYVNSCSPPSVSAVSKTPRTLRLHQVPAQYTTFYGIVAPYLIAACVPPIKPTYLVQLWKIKTPLPVMLNASP
jgi:hypothetical protein